MIDRELDMVHLAVRVGVILGVPVVLVAAVLRGAPGAWTAAGAFALVTGGFVASGLSLRWAVPRGSAMVRAVALGGMFARLTFYAVLLVLLAPTGLVDRPTIAIAAPLALLTLLAVEVRLVLTDKSFWWVDPAAAPVDGKDRA